MTGPNLLSTGPGAVIDGRISGIEPEAFVDAWRARASAILTAVGWGTESLTERVYPGGVTVYHSAPVDALYAATSVNEWAWAAATFDVGAGAEPESFAAAVERLRAEIAEEVNPPLIALAEAAAEHGATFLADDDHVSVGTGTGSFTWPIDQVPTPADVRWDDVHEVRRVVVTGTNGKTTVVRMVAAIGRASGHSVGFTCTDGIHVDGSLIDGGDWSGPGGGRAVLRDRRVELAVLETARGGMLRRGIAVDRADAALITNVAADHLGEWGIVDVDGVAEAKLVLAKAVRHGAPLIVNADDSVLYERALGLERDIVWYAADHPERVRERTGAGTGWIVEDGWIVRLERGQRYAVVEVARIPATLSGAAGYNVSNAVGASALSHAIGLDDAAISAGLQAFDLTLEQSPGRGNLFEFDGVRAFVDFVHNPHGFAAVGKMIRKLNPRRVGVMVGHAGDRDDDAICELANAAWDLAPRRVAVKDLPGYLRGREPGEAPAILYDELLRLGADPAVVSVHESEVDAARALLAWAEPGDFLLLSTQDQRGEVLELVRERMTEAADAASRVP